MTRWARRAEREEGKGGSRGSRESNGSRGSRGRAMTRRGRAMTNLEERSVRSRSHGTTGRNLPETPESWESRKLGADVTTNKSIIQGPAGQPQIEIVVGPQLNDTNADRPVRHSYHLLSRNYYE